MRPLRALLVFIAVVAVGGALAAPWLYLLAQSWSSAFPKLAGEPFHRFVNRSVLGLALLRSLGATSWQELGLVKPSGQWRKLAGGLALGFVSLACVAAAALLAGEVTWWSGLVLLPHTLEGLMDWQHLVPAFLCLTLAGAWLAPACQRTGNLYFSIGLHAGWIFWLKFYGFATSAVAGANEWLWGSPRLINGWLAFGVLAAGFVAFARATTPPRAPSSP